MLSLAGGAGGVAIGAAATASYAHSHGEILIIPAGGLRGGLAAAVVIGAVAGLLPAIRAARMSPTRGPVDRVNGRLDAGDHDFAISRLTTARPGAGR